ncbi:MAG TPA: hypothetical protein VJA21_23820, partial [Verrucomicrobiae bacterium]
MPTFGEFETVGQPLSSSDERGRLTTVWRARRSGSREERLYAIKCYAPRREETPKAAPDEALDQDLRIKFIKEVVEPLKRAQSKGEACLAPIHQFGTTDSEAWYVTDFYGLPNSFSNSLKQYITGKGEAGNAVLRHVVQSVVTACLALKRWRGYSHGNLKPSNVFRAGRSEWRKAPVFIADPYPAPPVQFARYEAGDLSDVSATLRDSLEAQDLAAIGGIILQLVERRLFVRNDDYNYPVERSRDWEALGKDADFWLGWCNKLLDPQLSLQAVNLEDLAKAFEPSAAARNLPRILAGAGAVCLVGLLCYGAVSLWTANREKKSQTHVRKAKEAFAVPDLILAQKEIGLAAKYRKDSPEVKQWTARINQRVDEAFDAALISARDAFKTNLAVALEWTGKARGLKPEDSAGKQFESQILQAQKYLAVLTEATNAWDRAEAAIKRQDYDAAAKDLTAATEKCVTARTLGDAAKADRLQTLLDQRQAVVQTAINANKTKAQQYATAMQEATNALSRAEQAIKRQDYNAAAKELATATEKCATARPLGDAAKVDRLVTVLNQRQSTVQAAINANKTKAEQYATAMQEATNALSRAEEAFKRQDYASASKDLTDATDQCATARPLGDAAKVDRLLALLGQRQRAVQAAINANKTKAEQYAAAMQDATNSWIQAEDAIKRRDYDAAAKELTTATEKCAAARRLGDAAAVDRLETVLKQRQTIVQSAINANKTRVEQYAAAMQDATNAWTQAEDAIKRQDYDTAAKDLNIATEKCAAARKL